MFVDTWGAFSMLGSFLTSGRNEILKKNILLRICFYKLVQTDESFVGFVSASSL